MTAADLIQIPGVLGMGNDSSADLPEEIKRQIPELFESFVEMRQTEGASLRFWP